MHVKSEIFEIQILLLFVLMSIVVKVCEFLLFTVIPCIIVYIVDV